MRKPRWTYHARVYLPKTLCTIYRDDAMGVQLQVATKRDWYFSRPKENLYFFIDRDSRVFRRESRMLRALSRIHYRDTHPLRPSSWLENLLTDDRMWKASLSRT